MYMVSKDVNNINESVVPLWPNEEGIGLLHLCKTGIVSLNPTSGKDCLSDLYSHILEPCM